LQQQRDGRENRERNCAKGSDYDVCSCSMNRPPALSFYLPGILFFPFSSGPFFSLPQGPFACVIYLKGFVKDEKCDVVADRQGLQLPTKKHTKESERRRRAKKKKKDDDEVNRQV
jgi:hypothetical protein